MRRLLDAGINVGLGTDVSGGHSASMMLAMQDALNVSLSLNIIKTQKIVSNGYVEDKKINRNYKPLEYKHVIYLATLGGANALSLNDVCGNFEVGKEFDALLIDVSVDPIPCFDVPTSVSKESNATHSRLDQMIQKFIYAGDDRNIRKVFVSGKQVKKCFE